MKPTLCIYHGNCADGFGAAWTVRQALGDSVEFYPGVYGHPCPDVEGRHVILVDFSYKREIMQSIFDKARTVLVLDHHKSAEKELAGLYSPNSTILFDMTRSGAVMAWNYFFPLKNVPNLLRYIQDRDLWQFQLPGSREMAAYIFSWPYDFEVWDKLVDDSTLHLSDMMREGKAILRKQNKDIEELLSVNTRWIKIRGHEVPVANMPYTLASDAAHYLCNKYRPKFAVCYFDRADCRVFSLRSLDDGEDVSVIAASYGGGGHAHASGFQMPHDWLGDDTDALTLGAAARRA